LGSPPNGFYAQTGDGPAPLDSATPPAHDFRWVHGNGSREVLSRRVPRLEAIQPPTGSVFVRTISLSSRTRAVSCHTHMHTNSLGTHTTHVNSHNDDRTHGQTHAHLSAPLVLCRYVGGLYDPLRGHQIPTTVVSRRTPFEVIRHSSVCNAARSSFSTVVRFPLFPNWPPTAVRDPFGVVR